jgi:cold shock CspA family protein
MAKSRETFNKREKEKQRQKEKQQKREKTKERKANQVKGKSLDQMMAYVDENGNITSTPQDPSRRRAVKMEDIQIGVPQMPAGEAPLNEGIVEYFNEAKGFGFIVDEKGGKYFFHVNQVAKPVREKDKVSFQPEKTPKGWSAMDVKKAE